jgi:hypothetical protein
MQQAMLLHALGHRRDDTLFNQFSYAIDGPLDADAFAQAWAATVQRHPALRTAFLWQDLPQPMQVVRQQAEPGFEQLDWRHMPPDAQDAAYADLLAADREAGFDPRRAPLMRFKLVRMAEDAWRFAWSSHHLVIDRWCIGTILSDVERYYAGGADARRNVTAAPAFRRYVDWLSRQDQAAAHAFWRNALAGFTPPRRPRADAGVTETSRLTPDRYASLTAAARRHGLTPGIVVQGAWALTLNRLLGEQDVVFGATVAGRPADIADVEHIVGSFINNVPVRRVMPAEAGLVEWLRDAQAAQFERTPFEYVSPVDIERCAGVNGDTPLFDNILVWLADGGAASVLNMRPLSGDYATALPVTLSVAESGGGLELRIERRPGRTAIPADGVLSRLTETLGDIVEAPAGTALGDLPGFRHAADFTPRGERGTGAATGAPRPTASDAGAASLRGREALKPDAMAELLTSEWQAILEIDDIDSGADFFELGGTSLQAARLHARIEAATRQAIPLLALFQDPTIRGMAGTLTGRDWPLQSGLATELRAPGRRPALFCIASPEVNAVGYSLLARHLPADQGVYVIQAPPVADTPRELDPTTLPALAGQYLEAVRNIQRSGPYRFLSMCAGSHITADMARLLEADGEQVEFFGVVNTWSLYTVSRLYYVYRGLNVLRWYATRLREVLAARRRPAPPPPAPPAERSQAESPPAPAALPDPDAAVGLENPWIRDVGFAHRNPGRPRIDAPVTVFRIRSQPFWRKRNAALGWDVQSKITRPVRLHGNDHQAIMREPRVRELAGALMTEFDGLQATRVAERPEPAAKIRIPA